MNIYSKKTKKIFTIIIDGALVAALVIPLVASIV